MRLVHTTRVLAGICLVLLPSQALAQIQLEPVVSNLTSPVFVGHAGDGLNRLFIVEQGGKIKVLQPGASTTTDFLDLSAKISTGGERGLLGLAFHPQYSSNGRFFVFYTRTGDGALVISEFKASPASANTADTAEAVLLTIPHPGFSNHNGGMLAFGADGLLYVGVGDGGGGNDPDGNAQDKETLLGKILRIDVTTPGAYASPADNPFVDADGLDEIYAYGLRNPWRFSFDRLTGQQWVGDVGQGAREEVDTPIVNGGNYGWPIYEGSQCNVTGGCTPPPNYQPPLFDYPHNGVRCSLTGGYVYRGAQAAVAQGTYLFGDYCSGEIMSWNGATQTVLLDTAMRISSFGEDEQGEHYVVDLNGSVSRIVSTATPCTYTVSPTRETFGPAGGGGSVMVTTGATCTWAATNHPSWIAIDGATRTGSGTISYTVAPYTGKPKKRNGSMTIAGQTVTVQQSR